MHACVSTYQFSPDGLDEAVREFEKAVPKVQEMEGNKGAVFLVDRMSAKGMTITYWESEQAMQGSTGAADEVREGRLAPPAAQSSPSKGMRWHCSSRRCPRHKLICRRKWAFRRAARPKFASDLLELCAPPIHSGECATSWGSARGPEQRHPDASTRKPAHRRRTRLHVPAQYVETSGRY